MNRITFVGNCQISSLSNIYDRFIGRPRGDVVTFVESHQDLSQSGRDAIEAADILVEQVADLRPRAEIESLSIKAERILVPLVSCNFLWPYAGEPHPSNQPTWFSPGGPYPGEMSDSYLNRLIAKGISPEEAAEEYLALDVGSVRKLDRLYELVMDRQRRRDEVCGFQIADEIETHFRTEPVFLTAHHPDLRVALSLAEQFLRRMGAGGSIIKRLRRQIRATPFPCGRLPIHPAVARHFGLNYADANTRYRYSVDATLTFREFVLRYMRGEWNRDLEEGIALSSTDPDAALAKLASGLDRSPEAADGYRASGDALLRRGELIEAERALRQAIDFAPGEPDSHHLLAVILHRLGRWSESATAAHHAIALEPGNPHFHAALANAALGEGNLNEAEHATREAIALDSRNGHLHKLLAHVLERRGEISAAMECMRQAIAAMPDSAGFHNHLSHLLLRQNQVPEALAESRHASTLDPDDVHIQSHLYHILSRAGRDEEAESALRAAVSLQPDNAYLHDQLGHVLARAERAEEAVTAFAEAVRLAPDNGRTHASLSHSLNRVGRFDDAIGEIRAAIALRPDEPQFYAHLANMLRHHHSDIAGAVAAYEKASTLAPDNAEFATKLAELRNLAAEQADERHPAPHLAVEGREGWLFHRVDAVFEQICEGKHLSPRNLSRMISLWEARQAWCRLRGMDYRILIVPERHVLYPDKLPDGFAPHPRRPALQLIDAAEPELRRDIIYPADRIRAGRAEHDVCFRTDVHWNSYGAYIGYRALMETIPRCSDWIIPFAALRRGECRMTGGLAIWLDMRVREVAKQFQPEPIAVRELFTNRTFKPGQVDLFETEHKHLPRLVLFRTSNSTLLLPFLYHHFSRIVAVASTAVHFDLLRAERPDVVISEISERYLAPPHEPPTEDRIRFPLDFDQMSFTEFTGVPLPIPAAAPDLARR